MRRIGHYKCKNIVITGGEPTLQKTELYKLTKKLQRKRYFVCLETNGTQDFDHSHIDWITVSPKTSPSSVRPVKIDELKVIYRGQSFKHWLNVPANHYYLQPCSNSNIRETVSAIKRNPRWKLSIQCQKLINIK